MTPADRDAAVALAKDIKASGVYEDSGVYVVGHRKGRGVSTTDVELLARAVLALAERPTCAKCSHWQDFLGAHETTAARALCLSDGPTAQQVTQRDWHCADHQFAPREGSTP